MDVEAKVPRKREPNFTADEKAILAQLVKTMPIIEAKLTDGKSIAKKKQAWDLLTLKYNNYLNLYKRDTATLKRAWDNLKATTRKARASQRGDLLRTGGGPSATPIPSQQDANIIKVTPDNFILEINNPFDSDGAALGDQRFDHINSPIHSTPNASPCIDNKLEMEDVPKDQENSSELNPLDNTHKNSSRRKHIDYVRREAVLRLKFLENKKKIEMQILKIQLEVENVRRETEEIKREAAKYLLEKNKIEYEKAKFDHAK